MKSVFLIVSVLLMQGCEFIPSAKFKSGDYVTTNLDQQIGRVDDVDCHDMVFTEKQKKNPCEYEITFPLKNGGFDSTWIWQSNLNIAAAPLSTSTEKSI